MARPCRAQMGEQNQRGGIAMEFHIYDFTHRYDKAKRMGERVAYVLSVLAAAAQLLNALGIIG